MNDRRPWYRLRLRTLVLVAVMGALVLFNIRGSGKAIRTGSHDNRSPANPLGSFNPLSLERGKRPAAEQFRHWRIGWPLTFLWRGRYVWIEPNLVMDSGGYCGASSRWLWPDITEDIAPGGFRQLALLANLAIGLLILIATGCVLERWRRRYGALQFGVRTLLFLPVIAAVMFAGLRIDPTMPDLPEAILVWPHWGFLWFGVGCTVYAGGLLVVRLARRLRARQRRATPEEDA